MRKRLLPKAGDGVKSNSSLPFALGMFYVLHVDGAIICGFVFDR